MGILTKQAVIYDELLRLSRAQFLALQGEDLEAFQRLMAEREALIRHLAPAVSDEEMARVTPEELAALQLALEKTLELDQASQRLLTAALAATKDELNRVCLGRATLRRYAAISQPQEAHFCDRDL